MTLLLAVRGVLLGLLLTFALAAAGAAVLRRRPRALIDWSDGFLVGGAAASGALVVLSMLVPTRALAATAVLLALAAATQTVAWLLGARRAQAGTDGAASDTSSRPAPSRPPLRPAELGLTLAILAVAAAWAILDLTRLYHWDGFQIWASKAQRLYFEGGLDRRWYAGETYDLRLLAYPPMVPAAEALLALLSGRFAFETLKPVFLPFYAAMLVSVYAAARTRLARVYSLSATLLVALLPGLSTVYAAGGYADMPQAAVVAAVAAAAFRGAPSLPWLIGALTLVKSEGTMLAAVAAAAVLAAPVAGPLASESRSGLARFVRRHARGAAIVGAFLALRVAYVRWLGVDDLSFRHLLAPGSLAESLRRLPHVARLEAESMLDPLAWGLLWPAFAIAALLLARRGDPRERLLAVAVCAAVAAYAVPFLETNWEVHLHVAQALPRLLSQVAPAAMLTVLIAFGREIGGGAYHRTGTAR